MLNWFLKIELTIYIKMDLALNNFKSWYAIKPNQPTNLIKKNPPYLLNDPHIHKYLNS